MIYDDHYCITKVLQCLSTSASITEKRCYLLDSKYALKYVRKNDTHRTSVILNGYEAEEYSVSISTDFLLEFNRN